MFGNWYITVEKTLLFVHTSLVRFIQTNVCAKKKCIYLCVHACDCMCILSCTHIFMFALDLISASLRKLHLNMCININRLPAPHSGQFSQHFRTIMLPYKSYI